MATTEPAMNKQETKESVKLTSVTELQVSTNPARLKLISLFCAAVYSWEDENAASTLIADCLEVCGGSQELLSKVLQTRFIDDRTPLRWVICNIGQHQVKELPPLPKVLLDHCGSSLSQEAIQEIQEACCDRNDNTMLRAAFTHPLLRGDRLPAFEDPVADVLSITEVSFRIPNFLDRMLMSKECHVDVVFRSSLYRLLIQNSPSNGKWMAQFIRVVPRQGGSLLGGTTLWLAQHNAAGAPEGMVDVGSSRSLFGFDEPFLFPVDFLRTRNSFIGKDRQLSGKVEAQSLISNVVSCTQVGDRDKNRQNAFSTYSRRPLCAPAWSYPTPKSPMVTAELDVGGSLTVTQNCRWVADFSQAYHGDLVNGSRPTCARFGLGCVRLRSRACISTLKQVIITLLDGMGEVEPVVAGHSGAVYQTPRPLNSQRAPVQPPFDLSTHTRTNTRRNAGPPGPTPHTPTHDGFRSAPSSYGDGANSHSYTSMVYGRAVNVSSDAYGFPADEEEMQRLQSQHRMFILFMGAKYPPEIEKVLEGTTPGEKRVLDIGCGNGEWIRDVARDFPLTECVAMDLVPLINTPRQPPNVISEVHDANLGLKHCYGKFDVVHCRLISSGVKDYQLLFEEISRALRPGGLVELAEVDWYTYDRNFARIDVSLDGAVGPPYWARFFAHVRNAIKHSGGDSDAATFLWQWVSSHPAFERINSRNVWLPAIPGDDKQYSEAGCDLMKKDVQAFLRSGEPMLRGRGMSEQDFEHLREITLKELHESVEPQYTRLDCVWALKRADYVAPPGQIN